jgi:hypothetical protein
MFLFARLARDSCHDADSPAALVAAWARSCLIAAWLPKPVAVHYKRMLDVPSTFEKVVYEGFVPLALAAVGDNAALVHLLQRGALLLKPVLLELMPKRPGLILALGALFGLLR